MKVNEGTNKDSLHKAKEYALRVISYRPRTVWEMSKKLADKGYDSEIISLVIVFLKEYSFLDDADFARMWISNRTTGRPTGRRRIFAELMEKRVDKNIIEQCMEKISSEKEEEMAMALVERKCCKSDFNYKKLKGFLVRRGFSMSIIEKVLSICEKNYPDEPR